MWALFRQCNVIVSYQRDDSVKSHVKRFRENFCMKIRKTSAYDLYLAVMEIEATIRAGLPSLELFLI